MICIDPTDESKELLRKLFQIRLFYKSALYHKAEQTKIYHQFDKKNLNL